MSNFSRIFGSAALAVASLAISMTPAPGADCEELALSFVERPLNDHIVDVGYPDKDSLGDLMVWANKVYDQGNAAEVGDDSGWCIRTAVGRSRECTFTVSLAEGHITAAGTAIDRTDSIFAVVGGTGNFLGMTGQMTWLVQDQGGLYRFEYKLRRCQ